MFRTVSSYPLLRQSQLGSLKAEIEADFSEEDGTLYSLENIASHCNLNVSDTEQKPDLMAKSIVKHLFTGLEVTSGRISPAALQLSSLFASSDQRPDVVVKRNGEFLFIVEVHSGDDSNSFSFTINKCLYVTVNALRLLRCVNSDVSKIISFVFPKKFNKKCVIEVEVEFGNFFFQYTLRPVPLTDVQEKLKRVAETQSYSLPGLEDVKQYCNLVIKLNDSELAAAAQFLPRQQEPPLEKVTQLESASAIVLDDGENILKFSSSNPTVHFLSYLTCSLLTPIRYSIPLHTTLEFVWYKKVKYDPLQPFEIYACSKEFTEQMHDTLLELHAKQFAHCDLRPENICIDEAYHLTLIDMDRVTDVGRALPLKSYGATCMYRIPKPHKEEWNGKKLDYMQLGLILAYVLLLHRDEAECPNYHEMRLDDMPSTIKNDGFLNDLLCKGEYDATKLMGSIISQGISTIKDIICSRQRHN